MSLTFSCHLGLQLFKICLHEFVAVLAQFASAACVQTRLDLYQFKQMFVIGAVQLAWLKLAGIEKALRYRRVNGIPARTA